MLTLNLPGVDRCVIKVVYDGCDSIRWLKHRGLLQPQVSITIDKTDVVHSIDEMIRKQSGGSLFALGVVSFSCVFVLNSHVSRVSKRRHASQSLAAGATKGFNGEAAGCCASVAEWGGAQQVSKLRVSFQQL